MTFDFSSAVLDWFNMHGRKDLPWQCPKTPYRTWLSEIMLQQTQVKTAIPYFHSFTETFPTVHDLAHSSLDSVLSLWSGLGYYSRARNLHTTAKIIVDEYHGAFPQAAEELIRLPGIGRSTAHAILSIAYNKPYAILDGNVKRVLCRFFAIKESPYLSQTEKLLWEHATQLMPPSQCNDYTQAMMDLGATICTRSKPLCQQCPLINHCQAYQLGIERELPTPKKRTVLPIRTTDLYVIVNHNQQLLLEKRANQRLWGGLWTLPGSNTQLFHSPPALPPLASNKTLSQFRHTFSHFHLDITVKQIDAWPSLTLQTNQSWYTPHQAQQLGLPQPIRKILHTIISQINIEIT